MEIAIVAMKISSRYEWLPEPLFFESQFPPSPAAVKHLSTTKLDEPGEDFISSSFHLGCEP